MEGSWGVGVVLGRGGKLSALSASDMSVYNECR